MNIYTENLGVEICLYYKNIVIQHGKVPKIFTLVKDNGHQYLFFVDDLDMDRKEESDFLAFIVQEENAICYARGGLFVQENEQQTIEVFITDKNDSQGIWCESKLTRDGDGIPTELTDFRKQFGPKEKIFFGWLFNKIDLSEDITIKFRTTWHAMKHKILNRQMQTQE
jgi:hypothetical protein